MSLCTVEVQPRALAAALLSFTYLKNLAYVNVKTKPCRWFLSGGQRQTFWGTKKSMHGRWDKD